MKKLSIVHLTLFLALAVLLVSGCAKKPAPTPTAASETPVVVSERPVGQDVRGIDERPVTEGQISEQDTAGLGMGQASADLQPIFFEFDQYTLSPQARQTLADNAAFLRSRSTVNVLIEGHCDERGSDEYNLALGERRARATRDYLASLGVAPERLSIISYGEERPLEQGSNEAAYAKNRRAEFRIR
ncbi:MAG: peptidoglycan-associated lipoprotein Pal [Desulfuromonadales bacterium]|nr:peptidoglycan-associated lipoprotein Pal [Desulfuromonadales bacterium]